MSPGVQEIFFYDQQRTDFTVSNTQSHTLTKNSNCVWFLAYVIVKQHKSSLEKKTMVVVTGSRTKAGGRQLVPPTVQRSSPLVGVAAAGAAGGLQQGRTKGVSLLMHL